uniref:Uncharacterized protein n=1 Tax=Leishmania guyanensis TaxID=5670 RepID=A0A1E1IYZ0_LEIGU|nr:Hypothetical protein BN36_2640440 [Leishmania guyanensis]CCM16564.1 Hypothetical protein BN36_2640680 [Leishmania guyanensis]
MQKQRHTGDRNSSLIGGLQAKKSVGSFLGGVVCLYCSQLFTIARWVLLCASLSLPPIPPYPTLPMGQWTSSSAHTRADTPQSFFSLRPPP